MKQEQFDESMARVTTVYRVKPVEVKPYLEAVFETCQRWSGYEFDQVTKRLVETCKFTPKPSDFIAAHKALAVEQGWNNKPQAPACERCEGTRWVEAAVRDTRTGKIHDAVKPCPRCAHHVKLPPGPPGFEDVPPETLTLEAQAAMLTPRGAARALEFADAMGRERLSDALDRLLTEVATTAEPEPEREPAKQAVNAKLDAHLEAERKAYLAKQATTSHDAGSPSQAGGAGAGATTRNA